MDNLIREIQQWSERKSWGTLCRPYLRLADSNLIDKANQLQSDNPNRGSYEQLSAIIEAILDGFKKRKCDKCKDKRYCKKHIKILNIIDQLEVYTG